MAMNRQRRTSNINNIVTYDTLKNVTLPADLTIEGLTGAGFVKSDVNGLLSVDTGAYLPIPSQTGNSGKFLSTDGSVLSWQSVPQDINIYSNDGTLTSNRTLTSGGFNLTFTGSNTASGAIARGLLLNHTLVAAANNDVLVGLDINPTFTIGSFTGLRNFGLRVQNSKVSFTGTYNATLSEGLNPQSYFSINTTFASANNAATQYVQISPTINLNTPGAQTAAALYVLPTFQNVGSANTYSIYAGGNNFFGQAGGTTTFSGANVNLLGQGGSATYLNATSPNSQSFRIRVNTTAAELAFQLDGSGNSDVRFLISNTERYRIFNNGNVLIQSGGTFTDAGFRLDVNGTQRITSTLSFGSTVNLVLGTVIGGGQSQYLLSFNSAAGWAFAITNLALTATYLDIRSDGRMSVGSAVDALNVPTSAQFQISSLTRGFLQPRMTTTHRDAIASPATGLSIYNTTTNTIEFYNGTSWVSSDTGTGAAGQIAYWTGANTQAGSATLTYTPTSALLVNNSVTAASSIARGVNMTPTLTAAANNDVLVGLDIAPTFSTGAFTNVSNIALRVTSGNVQLSNLLTFSQSIASITSPGTLTIGNTSNNQIQFLVNNAVGFRMYPTGNFVINNNTDAGFKLDVNGTSRLNGNVTIGNSTISNYQLNVYGSTFSYATFNNAASGIGSQNGFQIGLENTLEVNFINRSAAHIAFWTNNTERIRLFSNGNLAIGNTADVGVLFNVNGTGRFGNTLTVATGGFNVQSGTANFNSYILANGGGSSGLATQTANTTLYIWTRMSGVGGDGIILGQPFNGYGNNNKTVNIVKIPYDGQFTGGTNEINSFVINPVINNTGGTNTHRGIYYNPTLTSLTGTAHRAIETVSGDVVFGSTSGSVLVGTTTNAGYRLDVNGIGRFQNTITYSLGSTTQALTAVSDLTFGSGASITSGSFMGSFVSNGINTFNGDITVANSIIMSSQVLIQRVKFNSTGMTTTMTQGGVGVRALAAQIQVLQFTDDSTTGTLTHGAGMHILAPYKNSGNQITITNYYGIAINPSDEYSSQVAVTNRWGIYQVGSSDNNYFAGKVLVGTSTVSTYSLDVNGTARISGELTVASAAINMSSNNKINYTGNNGLRSTGSSDLIFHFNGSDNIYIGTSGVSINDGGQAPSASAQLQVNSTSRGFLPPRMTGAQAEAIGSPAAGLLVYANNGNGTTITSTGWWGYDGTTWVKLN